MKCLDRTIVAFGTLDLTYIVWVVSGVFRDGGFGLIWQSTVAFGLPHPALQVSGMLGVYSAILVCGFNLVMRRSALVWLNYVLFPLRVTLLLPTLFPLFAAVSFPSGLTFSVLVTTEILRVILVYRWARCLPQAVGNKVDG